MWNKGSINQSQINKLLENPDTKLIQILDDQFLIQSMRNNNFTLFHFFYKEEILNEMLDYILTNNFKDIENYKKICLKIIEVLNFNNLNFQKNLINNPNYINRLIEFPISKYSEELKLCGYFSCLLESIVRHSNGVFLQNNNEILIYLINNLSKLAYRDSLVKLISQFSSNNIFGNEIILEILKSKADPYLIITTLKLIFKEKKDLFNFECKNIINLIFNLSLNNKLNSILIYLFLLLIYNIKLNLNDNEINNYIFTFFDNFKSFLNDKYYIISIIIKVFNYLDINLLNLLFNQPTNMLLNQSILLIFEKLSIENQKNLIINLNFLDLLIKNKLNFQTNFQLIRIANIIKDLDINFAFPDEYNEILSNLNNNSNNNSFNSSSNNSESDDNFIINPPFNITEEDFEEDSSDIEEEEEEIGLI